MIKRINILDGVTPEMMRIMSALGPRQLPGTIGPALEDLTKEHIAALPKNSRGFPSTGFWEDSARAVSWEQDAIGLKVIVNKVGFGQRYYGGRIEPAVKRVLCFAIAEESYGKTPADFGYTPGVQMDEAASKRLRSLFAFSRGVTQPENKSIIPSDAAYAAKAFEVVREQLTAQGGAQ